MAEKTKNFVLRGLFIGLALGSILGFFLKVPGEHYLSLAGRIISTSLKEDIIGWQDSIAALLILATCFAFIGSAIGAIIQYRQFKKSKRNITKSTLESVKKQEEKQLRKLLSKN